MRNIGAAYMCAAAIALACLATGPGAGAQTTPATGIASGPATSSPQSAPTSTPATGPARIKLTISKETTYIDGPLNDDGTPNYFQYVRTKAGIGVTNDNNALVMLVKAYGPSLLSQDARVRALAALGLQGLDDQGQYMVNVQDYATDLAAKPALQPADLAKHLLEEPGEDSAGDFAVDQLYQARDKPWAAPDHPLIAQWLKANAKPLALVVGASEKPFLRAPMIPVSQPQSLLDRSEPALTKARLAAEALTARAMLHAGECDIAAASADLLAVHRLARLQAQEPTLWGYLVGLVTEALACEAEVKLATKGVLKPDEAMKHLAGIQKLSLFPYPADAFESSRLFQLDTVMRFYRDGPGVIESLRSVGAVATGGPKGWPLARNRIDWDAITRELNLWNDRLASCLEHDTYAERTKAIVEYNAAVLELAKKSGDPMDIIAGFAKPTMGSVIGLRPSSQKLARALAAVMMPSISLVPQMCDRSRQDRDLACVALAIAAFKGDTGKYPAKLDDLSPKYLKQVPIDRFTSKPLVYNLADKGYILYSLGPDMKDDGGLAESEPRGKDGNYDIVVSAP